MSSWCSQPTGFHFHSATCTIQNVLQATSFQFLCQIQILVSPFLFNTALLDCGNGNFVQQRKTAFEIGRNNCGKTEFLPQERSLHSNNSFQEIFSEVFSQRKGGRWREFFLFDNWVWSFSWIPGSGSGVKDFPHQDSVLSPTGWLFSRALLLQGVTLLVTLRCRLSIQLSVHGRNPLPPPPQRHDF